MHKNCMLNSDINRVLGELGHTDQLCIGDCGLPVPAGVEKNRPGLEERHSGILGRFGGCGRKHAGGTGYGGRRNEASLP